MSFSNFEYYNNLGFHSPYYVKNNKPFKYHKDFKSFQLNNKNGLTFDFLAFAEVNIYGYCLGDRTLVKGLNKTPWMAKPNIDNNDWCYSKDIKFIEKDYPQKEVALHFFNLLKNELLSYVSEHKTIGLLLTGGMDSRIVASVLQHLEKNGKLEGKVIKCFTWGSLNSRDVVYAKRIAKLYNWSWEHIEVNASQMKENIEISIQNGCEFAPIHLHGIPQLADRTDVDCYIAGSFGDSIGRAEFSGKHITNTTSLEKKLNNPNYLLRDDYGSFIVEDLNKDLRLFRVNFNQEKDYQNNEIDLQAHYMRRMLNPCMSIINKKKPVYQMFSSLEVYSYVWSINPNLRNDFNYKIILENYSPELLEIPWARTGLLYPNKTGTPDNYSKNHHNYSKLIREHFLEEYILKVIKKNEDIAKKNSKLKRCLSTL